MCQIATVDSVIRSRRAVRRFLDNPVDKKLVWDILDVARSAPSNSNTQPWRVYVVTGDARTRLSQDLYAAHRDCPDEHAAAFKHFPDVLEQKYLKRQGDFASRYYECLGIDRLDQAARHTQSARNFLFFDAPVGCIFTMHESLERGSWIDYGVFLQTIMIAAKARGIDTCPQISFAKYHAVIRRHLPIPPDETVMCGMSMGYADPQASVNSFGLPREAVEAFASFFGFDDADAAKQVNEQQEISNEQA